MDTYDEFALERKIPEELPGYDPSYNILHYASWSTYEEHGWMFVFKKDGQYYTLEYNYSVMSEDNTPIWCPIAVTPDQAITIMLEWEEVCDECELQ